MANQDYQSQLTELYNKLSDIDNQLTKLALKSDMITSQSLLTNILNSISSRLSTLTADVEKLQLTVSGLLTELRSK